ncbi:methylated-DNA--[protein]-cysteine S-methyltransferase [Rhodoblastus sp.]|uniref:methylated-DNA--[protein]-cysteine S-methyltransferase n=1 Tax=Rhodoblastus sp. TaxID=1962975 RepID=UPI003F9585E0
MTELHFFIESMLTPTGAMQLVTDEDGHVRALDWVECEERLSRLLRLQYGEGRTLVEPRAEASGARRALEAYFAGEISGIEALKVKTGGTPFQREVWSALREIPAGRTASYGEIATRIGRRKAVRAVGMANNGNPVAIVVPCHRVIGADGSLTGYGGGLERKLWLLRHEGAAI